MLLSSTYGVVPNIPHKTHILSSKAYPIVTCGTSLVGYSSRQFLPHHTAGRPYPTFFRPNHVYLVVELCHGTFVVSFSALAYRNQASYSVG
jgi:hypothetical protein